MDIKTTSSSVYQKDKPQFAAPNGPKQPQTASSSSRQNSRSLARGAIADKCRRANPTNLLPLLSVFVNSLDFYRKKPHIASVRHCFKKHTIGLVPGAGGGFFAKNWYPLFHDDDLEEQ